MNQEHYQNANTQPYDVKYISRCLMRNALFILMFACLAGVFSYIFLDHYKKDTYTASVNLYVSQETMRAQNSIQMGQFSRYPDASVP